MRSRPLLRMHEPRMSGRSQNLRTIVSLDLLELPYSWNRRSETLSGDMLPGPVARKCSELAKRCAPSHDAVGKGRSGQLQGCVSVRLTLLVRRC